jgi:hypothetical protein
MKITRQSRLTAALLGLVLPAVFIAIGGYAGQGLARFIISTAPREVHWAHLRRTDMLHRDALNYAIGYGYLIASTFAGVGFVVRRMQDRIVWLLISPIAWLLLFVAGVIVGYFALPIMFFDRLSKLVRAFGPSLPQDAGEALRPGSRVIRAAQNAS